MSDQVKTEQPNEVHISPSELNVGLGAWIDLNEYEPRGGMDDLVIVAFVWGKIGLKSAHEVRALKRSARDDGDACVISHWMPTPKAPNA